MRVWPVDEQLVVAALPLGDQLVAAGLTLADVLVVQPLGELDDAGGAGATTGTRRRTARMTPVSLPSAAAGGLGTRLGDGLGRLALGLRGLSVRRSASPAGREPRHPRAAAAGLLDGLLGLLSLALRGGDRTPVASRQLAARAARAAARRRPSASRSPTRARPLGGVEALLDRGVDRALAVLDLRLAAASSACAFDRRSLDLLLGGDSRVVEPALDVLEAAVSSSSSDRGVRATRGPARRSS